MGMILYYAHNQHLLSPFPDRTASAAGAVAVPPTDLSGVRRFPVLIKHSHLQAIQFVFGKPKPLPPPPLVAVSRTAPSADNKAADE